MATTREHGLPRLLRRWTVDQWLAIDREARTPEPQPGRRFDFRPLVILVTVAVILTLQEFFGDRRVYSKLWEPTRPIERYYELGSFVWWTAWRVGGYLVVPVLVVLAMPGERLRDYGLSFAGFTKHLKIYAVLFVLVLPAVWLMAQTKDFQRIYPFYKLAGRSWFDLLAWEGMYALQFLALEFFFRGFMLHGMRRALGSHAIWVMVVPYCMIHFGKTVAESLGAIVAGLVLGTVSMRTRSIWGGVVIHVAVAWTMDLLCIRNAFWMR